MLSTYKKAPIGCKIKASHFAATVLLLLTLISVAFITAQLSPPDVDASDSPPNFNPVRYVLFFGTRPEIIKMAPLLQAMESANLPHTTIFTGQHPDLVKPFKKFWQIKVDKHLNEVFQKDQSLSSLAGNLMKSISSELVERPNDVWVVQGDTVSALAAGMVAFFRGTPFIHLEAGLRTFRHHAPFPEEVNRRTLSLMASIHIAPTELAETRLLRQGVNKDRVFNLGNTGIDAARLAEPLMVAPEGIGKWPTQLVLVTLHRRENAHRMASVYKTIANATVHNVTFVVPVHPNPRASSSAKDACAASKLLVCVPPLGYGETQWMLKNSLVILTDSGGLQEEATWYGVPVLVLREVTERSEAITSGLSALAFDLKVLKYLLTELCAPKSSLHQSMSRRTLPFGDGHTSENIIKMLQEEGTKLLLDRPVSMEGDELTLVSKTPLKGKGNVLSVSHLPECSHARSWEECTSLNTIDVVLTVYKRDTLHENLRDVAAQSMPPSHVWVVQNEAHVDVEPILAKWRNSSNIPIDLVQSSANGGYHGRFHAAYYFSSAEYVSVWDDDVTAGQGWLEDCVGYSKEHNDALIGGNGRTLKSIMSNNMADGMQNWAKQGEESGQVDFVGHSWTLKREFLRFFLGSTQRTRVTGEDIQLSWALQQHGIQSWLLPHTGTDFKDNLNVSRDDNSSYKTDQRPRQWLFCKLLQEGFQPLRCENCDKETVQRCLDFFLQ